MGMSAQDALQLAAIFAQGSGQYARPGSPEAQLSQNLLGSAQAGLQAEMIKKAKKEAEKKEKSGLGGALGGALGTALGVGLAPFTGGASLAAAGALGGVAGSALGSSLAGGSPSTSQMLQSGVGGALSGYGAYNGNPVVQTANTAQQQSLGDKAIANALAPPKTSQQQMQEAYATPEQAMPTRAPQAHFGVGGRVQRGLNTLFPQFQPTQPRLQRNPVTGAVDVYYGIGG